MVATVAFDAACEFPTARPEEPRARATPPAREPFAAPAWTPPNALGTAAGAVLDRPPVVSWAHASTRLGIALMLSSLFGLALGMRPGGARLLLSMGGVPLGLAVVAALGTPALFIALLHAGVRVEALAVWDALTRAAATLGLVLAGLAPLAALVAVSSEADGWVAAFAWTGLTLSGGLGLRQLGRDVPTLLGSEAGSHRTAAWSAVAGFGVISALLALRIWAAALPALGGGAL